MTDFDFWKNSPITPEELDAAKSSINFSTYFPIDSIGNPTPEGTIAQMRGAKFDFLTGRTSLRDRVIWDKAMRDLACFLGFRNVNAYNSALMTERTKIFDRCTPPPAYVPVTTTYPFPVIVQYGQKKQLSDNQQGTDRGTIGKHLIIHAKPSLFDTGYYYAGQITQGAGDDFGNTGGDFQGRHKPKERREYDDGR